MSSSTIKMTVGEHRFKRGFKPAEDAVVVRLTGSGSNIIDLPPMSEGEAASYPLGTRCEIWVQSAHDSEDLDRRIEKFAGG